MFLYSPELWAIFHRDVYKSQSMLSHPRVLCSFRLRAGKPISYRDSRGAGSVIYFFARSYLWLGSMAAGVAAHQLVGHLKNKPLHNSTSLTLTASVRSKKHGSGGRGLGGGHVRGCTIVLAPTIFPKILESCPVCGPLFMPSIIFALVNLLCQLK